MGTMSTTSTLWTSALVALVGGAVGGVVGRVTAPASAQAPTAAAESPEDGTQPASGAPALAKRVGELEATVRELERERRLRGAARAYAEPSEPGSAPDGGVRGLAVVDDPVFEAAVRDVLDQVRVEQRSQRDTEREERRRESVTRWSGGLQAKLRLTDPQRQKIERIAEDYFAELRKLRDSDERPQSREQWRTTMQALREQSNAKIAGLLDPSQRRDYQALEAEEQLGFGLGGGGRRRNRD